MSDVAIVGWVLVGVVVLFVWNRFPVEIVALGASLKPVLLGVGVSCVAAFLTPVATAANLMVMGPGGYRFGDYWKFGLPLLALYGVVVVVYIPLIWRF